MESSSTHPQIHVHAVHAQLFEHLAHLHLALRKKGKNESLSPCVLPFSQFRCHYTNKHRHYDKTDGFSLPEQESNPKTQKATHFSSINQSVNQNHPLLPKYVQKPGGQKLER